MAAIEGRFQLLQEGKIDLRLSFVESPTNYCIIYHEGFGSEKTPFHDHELDWMLV
jgi:hypothetical protein